MRVSVRPKLAIHEVDRNRHRDRRHHARRQDEEQEIVRERHPEARETVGGERSEQHGEKCRTEADDDRIDESRHDLGRTGDDHAARADELVVPCRRRRQGRHELGRLPGTHGKEVDVAFQRRLEQNLGRIGDGVLRRFEGRGADPKKRRNRYERVEDDERPSDRLGPRRGFDDGMGGGCGAHRFFTRLSAFT